MALGLITDRENTNYPIPHQNNEPSKHESKEGKENYDRKYWG